MQQTIPHYIAFKIVKNIRAENMKIENLKDESITKKSTWKRNNLRHVMVDIFFETILPPPTLGLPNG